MKLHARRRRRAAAAVVTAAAALAIAGAIGSAPAFAAQAAPAAATSHAVTAPKWMHLLNLHSAYDKALGHVRPGKIGGITYRLGYHPQAASTAKAPAACTTEPNCPLLYGGGPVEHTVHIYLLLWGPTWATDSGEQASAAYLQSFYSGLGVQPKDNWSLTTSQYTDSSGGFPTFSGSQFDGVFTDTTTPPTDTTQSQFTTEAQAFATSHNLTSNPQDDQIVIATQSGTCPSGFYAPNCSGGSGSYCAYHSNVAGGVTFTNLPYLLDAGTGCGEGFVNSPGTYDGFSVVGGHEYAETITDPYPSSGWVDQFDGISGGEIGDKCAWGGELWGTLGSDPYGNVTLSTGTFAMQSLWSNAANGCVMAPTKDTLSVTNPGNQSTTAGSAVNLQVSASSSTGATLAYSASSLPAGLSINSATGLISGAPTTAGSSTVTVTASDTTGASRSVSFSWTVTSPGATVTVTSPGNQSTTAGTAVSLLIQATDSAGLTLTYTATGLPAGLSISTSTGLISGTPATAGTSNVTVTATDTGGKSGSANFTWTIKPASVCHGRNLLGNPGFETGKLPPWRATPGTLTRASRQYPARSGKWLALLAERLARHSNYLSQEVAVPAGCGSAKLSFWLKVDTNAPRGRIFATLRVQILGPGGKVLRNLSTYTNRNSGPYRLYTFGLGNWAGKKIVVKFLGHDNIGGKVTSFLIDDTSLWVS